MVHEIALSVEQTYRVFARYRVGSDLDFAAQIGLSAEVRERLRLALTTTPLRELPAAAIEAYFDYIDAAHGDGGFRADEFRYFLPRALELLALEPGNASSWLRECIECSIARAGRGIAWQPDELQVIRAAGIADGA